MPALMLGLALATACAHAGDQSTPDAAVESSDTLAQHSVIRAPFGNELTQEFRFSKPTPRLVLIAINNLDTSSLEREYAASSTSGRAPKKVRGAEVLPGRYSATVSCLNSNTISLWQNFSQEIEARPGVEYVLECIGYLTRDGDLHVVVHEKPLQSLAPGVTPLADDCVKLFDSALLPSLRVRKCKSKFNASKQAVQ